MKNCKQLTELSSRACDEKIGVLEYIELRLHILMCKDCRNFHYNNMRLSKILKAHQYQSTIKKP